MPARSPTILTSGRPPWISISTTTAAGAPADAALLRRQRPGDPGRSRPQQHRPDSERDSHRCKPQGCHAAEPGSARPWRSPPDRQAYVTWEVTVNPRRPTRRSGLQRRQGGEYQDASRPPQGTLDNQGIPVYRYEAPETVGTSGQMTAGGTPHRRHQPARRPCRSAAGELTIQVSPSLAAGMTDGLNYLEHFPYECIEQTISRFLPNVITTQRA